MVRYFLPPAGTCRTIRVKGVDRPARAGRSRRPTVDVAAGCAKCGARCRCVVASMDASNSSGYALLAALDGQQLPDAVGQAVQLLATVLVQDLEGGPDGVLRIARKVAPDRVISTVDPQARHGHKTNHRGFDGHEGHVAIDPDSEIITATGVTPGNTGDADPARDLIADLLEPGDDQTPAADDAAVYGECAY